MRRTTDKAFTLIETLVAAALLVVLGTVIWQLLAFGIRAHRKGEATRSAQAYARQVVETITAEVRSAVALPVIAPFLYSGVLYPDPWGGGVSFNPAAHFPRDTETINGIVWDVATNRLVFTRARRNVDESGFNPGDITNYIYVEYVVPADEPNVLLRNVYTINALGAQGHQLALTPTSFGTNRENWVVNPAYFEGGTNLRESQPLVELPETTDRIEFQVLHPDVTTTVNTSPEIYDPRTFTVRTRVRLGLVRPGADNDTFDDDDFLGKNDFEGQVRVQSHKTEY